MLLTDTFTVDGVKRTQDGYLAAYARVARTGIQVYKGKELGRPDLSEVKVYRPASEVFSKDALKSFAHRPITLTHPTQTVDSKNWKKYAVGHTGEDVVRDGEYIRVPMLLMDAAAIDAYEKDGVKELSMGYSTDLKWKKGKTEDGETYDAVQTEIRGNHLAMVPVARGGEQLRIGDTDFSKLVRRIEKLEDAADKCPNCGSAVDDDAETCPECGYDIENDPEHLEEDNTKDADLSTAGRKKEAASGAAMPDGSFPIKSANDVSNAVHDWGRAGSKPAVKAHIISRAKSLGAESELPDDWVSKSTKDAFPTKQKGNTMSATVLIDGVTIEVADEVSASVIKKHVAGLHSMAGGLQDKLDKSEAAKKDDDEESKEAQDGFKKTIDAQTAEIATLKKQVTDAAITPAILDQLVKDRSDVAAKAKKVLGDKLTIDGKSVEDMQKQVVDSFMGDAAKAWTKEQVSASFNTITADGKKLASGNQTLRDAIKRQGDGGGAADGTDVRDAAFAEYENRQSNAWRTKPGAAKQ